MRRGRFSTAGIAVVAIGVLGVACSLAVFDVARRAVDARVHGLLELRAEWRARDVEYKIRREADSVGILASYIAAQDAIDPKEFHRFARLTHESDDPKSALSWYPWVKGDERAAFVAAARQGRPDFEVRQISSDDRLVAAAQRDAYLPELYEETFDDVPGAPGFDLLFRPERKAQVLRVRDDGKPLVTAVFPMLLGGNRVAGFIALWPVYETATIPATMAERRTRFRGVAAGRFRLDRLLPEAVADTPKIINRIDFFIDRGRDGDAPQLAASYDPATEKFTIGAPPAAVAQGSLNLRREFDVYGRHWTLVSHFSPATVASLRSNTPWDWLITGLVLTALVTFLFRREQLRRIVVQRAVEQRTAELTLANSSLSREIEEHQRSEQLARESEEQLNQAQHLAHMGNIYIDFQTRKTGWSDETYRIFGMSRETFVPSMDNFLALVHRGDQAAVLAMQEQVRRGENPEPAEYRIIRPDGTVRQIHRQSEIRRNEAGEPRSLVATIHDVTEQRRIEDQLRQAQKMEAVGTLTGGLAHDFNNHLGVIILNLDVLRERLTADHEAEEMAGEAMAAAMRGAELIRRLLAFARRQPLQPQRTEINRLASEMTKLLDRTLREDIKITLDLDAAVWTTVIDPAQLESALANLATNARDAMPNGGELTIATGNRHLDEDYASQHNEVTPGEYVMIEVSDSGTGMKSEVLAQVFEPFFTTKTTGRGTGLGLSMVYGFIKQSGGHINIYSELGVGTTIRLYLPRADADADAAASGEAAPQALVRGGGETVLAVEDNPSLRRVVVRQLGELGYRVLEAGYGEEALEILQTQPVALLFTDVVLPGGMSGYELTRTALSRWPGIKVVLTSGFPENRIGNGTSSPNTKLLSKPYRKEDLARVVRQALGETGA